MALPGAAIAQPEPVSDPPAILMSLAGSWAGDAAGAGTVELSLEPLLTVAPARLTLVVGGAVEASPPAGFSAFEALEGESELVAGLSPVVRASRDLDLLADAQETVDLALTGTGAGGYGYVTALVESLPGALPLDEPQVAVLFFFMGRDSTYFSPHSVLDLRLQAKRDSLAAEGLAPPAIDPILADLRESGAEVTTSVAAQPPPGGSAGAETPEIRGPAAASPRGAATAADITVQGRVEFTSVNAVVQPVRFAEVEIWDDGSTRTLLTTVSTDAGGSYSAVIDNTDTDGTGLDIFVRALSRGPTVAVHDGPVHAASSLPALVDVPDGAVVTIDMKLSNDEAAFPNNTAFEVYEAVNYLSRFVGSLEGTLPAQVDVWYPQTKYDANTSYYDASGTGHMAIGLFDTHDWDNVQHEYGHRLQDVFGFLAGPLAQHSTQWNLCGMYGKSSGIALAFKEGWPTFFAVSAQVEEGLSALGITHLGDTHYQDVAYQEFLGTILQGSVLDYDLESMPAIRRHGEGNTGSIMGSLWDFYDPTDDAMDVGVQIPPAVLWNLMTVNDPVTFSQFWKVLTTGRPTAERVAMGAILSEHLIASQQGAPADGYTQSSTTAPATFAWTGNLLCSASASNERYRVVFYDDLFTSTLFTSPWSASTGFTPTGPENDVIFAGPNGSIVRWVVESEDQSAPSTGPYNGGGRTLVDESEPSVEEPDPLVTDVDRFAVSLHAGSALPGSGLSAAYDPGGTVNADVTVRITPDLSLDLRWGYSNLPAAGSGPDLDIWNLSINTKLDIVALGTFTLFLNGGAGSYWVEGVQDWGGNLGAGLAYPLAASLDLELTFNHHWISTGGGTVGFSKLQAGLLWWP